MFILPFFGSDVLLSVFRNRHLRAAFRLSLRGGGCFLTMVPSVILMPIHLALDHPLLEVMTGIVVTLQYGARLLHLQLDLGGFRMSVWLRLAGFFTGPSVRLRFLLLEGSLHFRLPFKTFLRLRRIMLDRIAGFLLRRRLAGWLLLGWRGLFRGAAATAATLVVALVPMTMVTILILVLVLAAATLVPVLVVLLLGAFAFTARALLALFAFLVAPAAASFTAALLPVAVVTVLAAGSAATAAAMLPMLLVLILVPLLIFARLAPAT